MMSMIYLLKELQKSRQRVAPGEIEENNRIGKNRLLKKIGDIRGYFMQGWA